MHVVFDPDSVDWSSYFQEVQVGGNAYFMGAPHQRGAGIGSVFGSLFRFLLPMFKSIGRELGKEGLAVGSRVLDDVARGEHVRDAFVNQTSDGMRNLLSRHDVSEGLKGVVDMAQRKVQKGSGRGQAVIRGKPRGRGRSVRKDSLGFY